jgi:hypothetical protein
LNQLDADLGSRESSPPGLGISWEILHLRRLKGGLLRIVFGDAVQRVAERLKPISRPTPVVRFAVRWMNGDSATRNEFQSLLKKAGLGMEDVMAEALSSNIDAFERFDRMLASAEARRNGALRQIDLHRSTLGAAVRQVVDKVEDAERRALETGDVTGEPPP